MRKQERATRTRHALIRSAARQFVRQGYAQARLVEISAGAGVSAGALHFHFESKAAVADAVRGEAGRLLREAAALARERQPRALQALVDMSHILGQLLREDVVVQAGYQLDCDPSATAGGAELHEEWLECVDRMLAAAASEGVLGPGVDRGDLVTVVVSATIGLEALGRHDGTWLLRSSLTGFWRWMLPSVATPQALPGLCPQGDDLVLSASGRPVAGLMTP
ncbi:ScbR family autoregulator-binding transcription factor [Streptomyces amakusaensis]|uniref:ScbR family autoregulator-binding transcription factor n=1 Tax=Streptomyces amakusaensis TaxID=67271 RepID=A0ABW0AML8_9ACTN